ncbi:MAG: tetratricopeptide repeat protein [Leptolyngbyaceae cyanobacterium bins.349]|nr:tetratricopeptide repeat protein [Leptolyngbyaceae cyanobacterium bins.349]
MTGSSSSPLSSDSREAAEALFDEGVIEYDRGQYDNAIAKYQEALTIFRNLNDAIWSARALNALGLAFHNQALSLAFYTPGDIGEREKAFTNAAQSYQESLQFSIEDRGRTAEIFTNLGEAYKGIGNYSEAIKAYQKALEIYSQELQNLENIRGIRIRVLIVGLSHLQLKQYDESEMYCKQALEILAGVEDIEQVNLLVELGDLYFSKGEKVLEEGSSDGLEEFSIALEFFYKAWQIHRSSVKQQGGIFARQQEKDILERISTTSGRAANCIEPPRTIDDTPPTIITPRP